VDYTDTVLVQFAMTFDAAGHIRLDHRWTRGRYGSGPGEMAFPQCLTIDRATGTVYVGDLGNRSIVSYSAAGDFLARTPGPRIRDWQVMDIRFGADGRLYTADPLNGLIWQFLPGLTEIRKIEAKL